MDEVREIEREIGELRRELRQALAQSEADRTTLAELETQRAEASERLDHAQQLANDVRVELERLQAALEEARTRASLAALEEAVGERDRTAEAAAGAIAAAIESLDDLDRRREAVARARTAVTGHGLDPQVPAEPEAFAGALERLVELVRGTLQDALDDELLEAAARSRSAGAIDELPPHLREAARQRRRALVKSRLARG
jgi:chromosome segregation ATPase